METIVLAHSSTAKLYEIIGFKVIYTEPVQEKINEIPYKILNKKELPFILVQSELYELWQNALKNYNDDIDDLIWLEIPSKNGRKNGNELRRNIRLLTGIS